MSITRVAKLAGVSSSTVSRVINNHPRVAPETEKTVRKAMEELGYTPSDRRPGPKSQARLRTESKNIAFLVFGASNGQATPAFADLLRGVSMGATENNLNLNFHYVPDPDQLPPRVLEQGVDGILLHGARPGPEIERRLRRLPTVWLMGNRRRPEWGDQVMPDAYEIGHLAAQYLIDRGHTHMAFMNLDRDFWAFRQYYLAFSSAATDNEHNVTDVEQSRQSSLDYWRTHTASAVDALIERFMSISPRPTGIFVADDTQVALLQPALQNAGVKIGRGETQVVSCNNEKPFLIGLGPRPAVVDIRVESIGRRGVEQLMWRMTHAHVVERIISAVEPFMVESEDDRVVTNRGMANAISS